MPAVNFTIVWPDGEQGEYYSPSTIIHEHLNSGATYSQQEFMTRIHLALTQASERVRQRFGFACSAASTELANIECKLDQLRRNNVIGDIQVLEFKQ